MAWDHKETKWACRMGPELAGSAGHIQGNEQRSEWTEDNGSLFILVTVREGNCKCAKGIG